MNKTLKTMALGAVMMGALALPLASTARAEDPAINGTGSITTDNTAATPAATSSDQSVTTPAGEGTMATKPQISFNDVDKDQSGFVSKSEYVAFAKTQSESKSQANADFKKMDSDKDGKLSSSELL